MQTRISERNIARKTSEQIQENDVSITGFQIDKKTKIAIRT